MTVRNDKTVCAQFRSRRDDAQRLNRNVRMRSQREKFQLMVRFHRFGGETSRVNDLGYEGSGSVVER